MSERTRQAVMQQLSQELRDAKKLGLHEQAESIRYAMRHAQRSNTIKLVKAH